MPTKRKHSPWKPTEPARARAYVKLKQRIDGQDNQITWLLRFARSLQQRIEQLEASHVRGYGRGNDRDRGASVGVDRRGAG